MIDMVLCSTNGAGMFDFLFNNLWDNAYYWRYTTIIAIFLMVVYKRKVSFYEKHNKRLENDKKISRKAIFTFSEIDLKELMKNLIGNNCYYENQLKKLKDFENYLNETGNNLISENLKKSVEELKLALKNANDCLGRYFIKDIEQNFFKFKKDPSMDSVDEFEFQNKILTIVTAFESKYSSFMQEVKNEFM
ncbi:MAG: hypothetical protein A2039_07750 [Candidatus Melainabacteria bacterium GWA2_34_9]|nr:MAG: hypothetical protein A2039_07750 [Candidatus Melainabacteria bacterium GWA2_34_9]